MAIEWVTVGKIVLAAGQAFMAHLQGRRDDQERERDRDAILTAINRLRSEILDRLNELQVNELRGELEGFQSIYSSYSADPEDPFEEGRLVSLIDDSARVLGRLGAHLETVGSNPDLAFEAWSIYMPLLYLRAQAMTEREATFGAAEAADAIPSFDMAIPRLEGLLSYLRSQSDSQFGPVVCKPVPDSQDTRVCWYRWGGQQFICGSTSDPRGLQKCQTSRETNMDRAYRNYDGVREITAARNQLISARGALETLSILDVLETHGVAVGELVLIDGAFARTPRPPRPRTSPDPQGDVVDWFG